MSLSDRAILVQLSISCWQGTVGRDPDDTNNLDPDRDRIIHSVVPKTLLVSIAANGRSLRRRHYQMTAPWDDNGLRLVPSQLLLDYTNNMRKWRGEFDAIVAAKLPMLEQAIDPAYKNRFKDLSARFGTRMTFYPVPDGGKMPLLVDTVDAAVRASIVESMTTDTARRSDQVTDGLLKAVKDLVVRLLELRSTVPVLPRGNLPTQRSVAASTAAWEKINSIIDSMRLPIQLLVGVDPSCADLQIAATNHEWSRLLDLIRTRRNGQN